MLLAATLCATGLSIQSRSIASQIYGDFKIEGQRVRKIYSEFSMKETLSNGWEKLFHSGPVTAYRKAVHNAFRKANQRENIFRQARTAFRNSELGEAYNRADKAFEKAVVSSTILNNAYDWIQYLKNL